MTIIDQARANKYKAEKDITQYTNLYNQAVAGQRNSQQAIYSMEVRISQISSAMSNINDEIGKLSTQAGSLKAEWTILIKRRDELQSQVGFIATQKSSVQRQVDSINAQISLYR